PIQHAAISEPLNDVIQTTLHVNSGATKHHSAEHQWRPSLIDDCYGLVGFRTLPHSNDFMKERMKRLGFGDLESDCFVKEGKFTNSDRRSLKNRAAWAARLKAQQQDRGHSKNCVQQAHVVVGCCIPASF